MDVKDECVRSLEEKVREIYGTLRDVNTNVECIASKYCIVNYTLPVTLLTVLVSGACNIFQYYSRFVLKKMPVHMVYFYLSVFFYNNNPVISLISRFVSVPEFYVCLNLNEHR